MSNTQKKIQAIILAAGMGSRLFPLTSSMPKCLVKVRGNSILNYQLNIYRSLGITDIIVLTGYLNHLIVEKGIKKIVNPDFLNTNMFWTLLCAEKYLNKETIISYGDILFSKKNLNLLVQNENNIALAIDLDWRSYWEQRFKNPLSDAETLKLDSVNNIIEIGNRTDDINEIQGQYIGLMKFNKSGLQILKSKYKEALLKNKINSKNLKQAYMTDVFQKMIDDNIKIKAVKIRGGWLEIDTINDIKVAEKSSRFEEILNYED